MFLDADDRVDVCLVEVTRAVNRQGGAPSHGLAARFGLTSARILGVSQRRARTHKRHEVGRKGAAL